MFSVHHRYKGFRYKTLTASLTYSCALTIAILMVMTGMGSCGQSNMLDEGTNPSLENKVYMDLGAAKDNELVTSWVPEPDAENVDYYLIELDNGKSTSVYRVEADSQLIEGKQVERFRVEEGTYSVSISVVRKNTQEAEFLGKAENTVTVTTLATAPAAPVLSQSIGSRATSASTASMDLNWAPPAHTGTNHDGSEGTIVSYILYWKKDAEGSLHPGDYEEKMEIDTGDASSAIIDNLALATQYKVLLIAVNSAGIASEGASMVAESAGSSSTAPGPAEIKDISSISTANDASVTLWWNSPAGGLLYDGNPASIATYRVYWQEGETVVPERNSAGMTEFSGNAEQGTIDSLAHNQEYTFLLIAVNNEGRESQSSNQKTITTEGSTLTERPQAPGNFSADSIAGSLGIALYWDPAQYFGTDENGDPADFQEYRIYWEAGESVSVSSEHEKIIQGVGSSEFTITPAHDNTLTGETRYTIAIITVNNMGVASEQSRTEATTQSLVAASADITPSLLPHVETNTEASITVRWLVPDFGKTVDGAEASIEHYRIYWQEGSIVDSESPNRKQVSSDNGAAPGVPMEETINALTPGLQYSVIVIALSSNGEESRGVTRSVRIPDSQEREPAPVEMSLTSISTRDAASIDIVWTAPDAGLYADGRAAEISGYTLYWKQGASVDQEDNDGSRDLDSGAVSARITALNVETEYAVMVVLRNDMGKSISSSDVITTPPATTAKNPGEVTGLQVSADTDIQSKKIMLAWEAPESFGQNEDGIAAELGSYRIYIEQGETVDVTGTAQFTTQLEEYTIDNIPGSMLEGDQEYRIAVVVVNTDGRSSAAVEGSAATNNLATAPGEISGGIQADLSHKVINQIKLTWAAVEAGKDKNGDAVETRYELYYGNTYNSYVDAEDLQLRGNRAGEDIVGSGTAGLSYTLSGLIPNSYYDVAIIPVNSIHSELRGNVYMEQDIRSNGVTGISLQQGGMDVGESIAKSATEDVFELTGILTSYNVDTSLNWTNSDMNVAIIEQINDNTAVIRPVGSGETVISVQSSSDNSVQDSVLLQVSKEDISGSYRLSYGEESIIVPFGVMQSYEIDSAASGAVPEDADMEYSLTSVIPIDSKISVHPESGSITIGFGVKKGSYTLSVEGAVHQDDRRYSGTVSGEVAVTVAQGTAPGAVAGLNAVAIAGTTNVALSWEAPGDFGADYRGTAASLQEYRIFYKKGSVVSINGTPSTTTTLSYTVSDLEGGTRYRIAIVTVNSNTLISTATEISVDTNDLSTAPGVAGNIRVDNTHTAVRELRVLWDTAAAGKNRNGADAASEYILYYAQNAAGYQTVEELMNNGGQVPGAITEIAGGSQSYALTELSGNSVYNVAIVAVNSEQRERKSEAVFAGSLRSNGVSGLEIQHTDGSGTGSEITFTISEGSKSVQAVLAAHNVSNRIRWQTSHSEIATVSPAESAPGEPVQINLHKAGASLITASSVADPDVQDGLTVMVSKDNIDSGGYSLSYGTESVTTTVGVEKTISPDTEQLPESVYFNYEISVTPGEGHISVHPTDGTITIAAAAAAKSYTAVVTATVESNNLEYTGSLSAELSIIVEREDISVNHSLEYGATEFTSVVGSGSVLFPDSQQLPAGVLSYEISVTPEEEDITIHPLSGAVTFTPAVPVGSYTLTVTATIAENDPVYTGTLSVEFSIIIEKEDISITHSLEYGTGVYTVPVRIETNISPNGLLLPESVELSYEIAVTPDEGHITIHSLSGDVTVADTAEAKDYTLTVTATVAENDPVYTGTLSAVVSITVEKEDISVNHNLEYGGPEVGSGVDLENAFYPDSRKLPESVELSYEVAVAPDEGHITIHSQSGDITVADTAAAKDYTLTVTATVAENDPVYTGNLVNEFTITVTPVLYKADTLPAAQSVFSPGDVDNPYLFLVLGIDPNQIASATADITISDAQQNSLYGETGLQFSTFDDPDGGTGMGVGPTESAPVNWGTLPTGEIIDIELVVKAADGTEIVRRTVQVTVAETEDVYTWRDLQKMQNNLASDYIVKSNIDFPEMDTYGFSDKGFIPIGGENAPFTGTLDGAGFRISGLVINDRSLSHAGLFGKIEAGSSEVEVVRNLTLEDFSIVASSVGGPLAGYLKTGTVNGVAVVNPSNIMTVDLDGFFSIADYKISRGSYAGGLIGIVNNGAVSGFSEANITVIGSSIHSNGGLVGMNQGTVEGSFSGSMMVQFGISNGCLVGYNHGTVKGSSNGTIIGNMNIGGLVGSNEGTVVGSFSGTVTGSGTTSDTYIGGLVGFNNEGTVIGNFSGSVTTGKGTYIGGLIGYNNSILIGYSTGTVTGKDRIGGLVGKGVRGETIGYSTGTVTGESNVGGLLGEDLAKLGIISGYWDIEGTGQATTSGGIGSVAGISSQSNIYIFTGDSEAGGRTQNAIYDAGTGSDPEHPDSGDLRIFDNEAFTNVFSLPTEDASMPKFKSTFNVSGTQYTVPDEW